MEVHGKQIYSLTPFSCLHCHIGWLFHEYRESDLRSLPVVSEPRSFDENTGKAVKEEKIKSVPLSALISADLPERACEITILPIKQQDPGHPSERDLPNTGVKEQWTGEGRVEKWSGGKRKVSHIYRLNGEAKCIELKEDWWSGSWYVGTEERGGLVGHYMNPEYNTSLSFSQSWRFMSLLCLPQPPYGFF